MDIFQVGSSINIEQIIQIPYCNPQKNLKLSYSISDNNIEILEVFDTNATESECITPVCSVYILGQLDNLEKENYIITFVFDDKNNNQTRIISEKEFKFKEDYFSWSFILKFLEYLKGFQ